ncbi:MAG: Na+/H+ antiporter NhaC family protein, partial [FCB group bacterium]|nr:Na+/H+ antiporter NhaC family protein [FCB group bacterium]
VKALMLAMIILILAWALGKICDDLGTAVFVSAIVKGSIAPWMLPALTFIIAAFISFSTGTSWGTMAILIPIIIPVTFNLLVPDGTTGAEAIAFVDQSWHIMIASIGSVLAGAIFGDHCSPISDTTIMSSMTSGADHIDHVRTQMPYALVIGAVGITLGNIPAGLGVNPFLMLAVGMVVLWVVFRFVGGRVEV